MSLGAKRVPAMTPREREILANQKPRWAKTEAREVQLETSSMLRKRQLSVKEIRKTAHWPWQEPPSQSEKEAEPTGDQGRDDGPQLYTHTARSCSVYLRVRMK